MITECSWCGKKFSHDDKIILLASKVDKSSGDITGDELKAMEGQSINVLFYSPAKNFKAYVPYSNDLICKAGNDIVFCACSISCIQALSEAIQKSKKLVVSNIEH